MPAATPGLTRQATGLLGLALLLALPSTADAQVDAAWKHIYERMSLLRGDPHVHTGNVGTLIDGAGGLDGQAPLFDPARGCTESCWRPLVAAQAAADQGMDWVNVLTHHSREGVEGQTAWWTSAGTGTLEACSGHTWPTDPAGYDLSLEEDGSVLSQNGWDWRQAECDRAMARNPGFICFAGTEWGGGQTQAPASDEPGHGGHKIRMCPGRVTPAGGPDEGDYGGSEHLFGEVELFEQTVAESCHVHHAHPCKVAIARIGPPNYETGGGGNPNVIGGYAVNGGLCLARESAGWDPGETSFVDYLNSGRRGSAIMESDVHLRPQGAPGCTEPPVGEWCRHDCRSTPAPPGEEFRSTLRTSCYANRRTPEALIQALQQGRCFGHQGPSALVDPQLRLYLHDEREFDPPAIMGQSLDDDDQSEVLLVLHVSESSQRGWLERVRIYHNDASGTGYTIVKECGKHGPFAQGCQCTGNLCVVITSWKQPGNLDGWYFATVTTQDGGWLVAVSSPVWRNFPAFHASIP